MDFTKEITDKKNKLQEMAIEMKKIVDSLIDDVNKKLPDDQTSTPVNRNLFKKINSNDFYCVVESIKWLILTVKLLLEGVKCTRKTNTFRFMI
jgi:hypothetical protein